MMTLKVLSEQLNLQVNCCADRVDSPVTGGYCGDLLSDVIANCEPGSLWITRQVHQNIVAVALIKDVSGIIIVQGAVPDKETVSKATEQAIPVLTTRMSAFETAGRVFELLHHQREEDD